jgi:hypothetical protein
MNTVAFRRRQHRQPCKAICNFVLHQGFIRPTVGKVAAKFLDDACLQSGGRVS